MADPLGTLTEFLLLILPSAEREGGVFSEYHRNLYFPKVKQISLGGSIPLWWDRRGGPSDSAAPPAAPPAADALTILLNLLPPAHKSLLPREQSGASPAPPPSHGSP